MLAKYKLSLILMISLMTSWIVPFFFPFCRFFFFAPFLIVCIYQKSLWPSLWIATAIGIFDDLSTTTIFGLSSCNYVITCALLYRLKRHFFEDNPSTLFIMTLFFSFISISIKTFFSKIFGFGFPLSLEFVITDIVVMPFFEGIYAYLLFVLPYQLFKLFKRYFRKALSD